MCLFASPSSNFGGPISICERLCKAYLIDSNGHHCTSSNSVVLSMLVKQIFLFSQNLQKVETFTVKHYHNYHDKACMGLNDKLITMIGVGMCVLNLQAMLYCKLFLLMVFKYVHPMNRQSPIGFLLRKLFFKTGYGLSKLYFDLKPFT